MLVLGSVAFLFAPVIPIIMVFICLFKLCILFLSEVETLVIVPGGKSDGIFTRSSGINNFVMNQIR